MSPGPTESTSTGSEFGLSALGMVTRVHAEPLQCSTSKETRPPFEMASPIAKTSFDDDPLTATSSPAMAPDGSATVVRVQELPFQCVTTGSSGPLPPALAMLPTAKALSAPNAATSPRPTFLPP